MEFPFPLQVNNAPASRPAASVSASITPSAENCCIGNASPIPPRIQPPARTWSTMLNGVILSWSLPGRPRRDTGWHCRSPTWDRRNGWVTMKKDRSRCMAPAVCDAGGIVWGNRRGR